MNILSQQRFCYVQFNPVMGDLKLCTSGSKTVKTSAVGRWKTTLLPTVGKQYHVAAVKKLQSNGLDNNSYRTIN